MSEQIDLTIREIHGLHDRAFPSYLDLYETAFPANERIPVSGFVRILQAIERGEERGEHLLIACDSDDALAAMALIDMIGDCSAAYLVYLAVAAERRSGGIGGRMLAEINRRAVEWNPEVEAMVLEVDRPENNEGEEREFAERRIRFYERADFRLLTGIDYTQRVDFYPDGRPMHLMFLSFGELSSERAFEIGECIFGEDVSRREEQLALE